MSRIIIFLKYPEPGRVKTRLARSVGPGAAARLARHFAEATLARAASTGLAVSVCYAPADRGAEVRSWLGPGPDYLPQRGSDLGARMRNAFADVFAAGTERCVLIGADAPDRPVEFLAEALELLDGHDAVLGLALDGGYQLIAFRNGGFAPEAFSGIDWGGARVLAQTLDALRAAGRTASLLPPWRDIDDKAGLDDYLAAHPEAGRLLDGDVPAAAGGVRPDENINDRFNDAFNDEHDDAGTEFRSKSCVVEENSGAAFNDDFNDGFNEKSGAGTGRGAA